MNQEGIDKALSVLNRYRRILEDWGVSDVRGFITEPGRNIENQQELLEAFRSAGFEIEPLSGEQEAAFDFYGSRLDTDDIRRGVAFDIGGGSTEIVAFDADSPDGLIHALTSMPVGCVRLKDYPLTREVPLGMIQNTLKEMPQLLDTAGPVIIGSGGTVRAVRLMYEELYPFPITKGCLEDMFERLKAREEAVVEVLHRIVTPDRRDVILPGLNMVLALMEAFSADELRGSMYGVREGYLLYR